MAAPLPAEAGRPADPDAGGTPPRDLTRPARRAVRWATAAVEILALVLAVAAVLTALIEADTGAVGTVPGVLAAAAMLLTALAAAALVIDRRHRELPRRARGFGLLGVGLTTMLIGQAAVFAFSDPTRSVTGHWIQAGTILLGAPLFGIGLLFVAWPPRMTRRDAVLVGVDTTVAALCLAVVWLLWVVPAHPGSESWLGGVALTAAQYASCLFVVILAAASRRSGALPIQQLIALQLAMLGFAASSVVADGAAVPGTTVGWAVVGFVASGWVFRYFAMGPAVAGEDRTSIRLRSTWAIVVPFLPVPLAAASIIVYRLAVGPVTGPTMYLALVALVTIVGANVALRLVIARDFGQLRLHRLRPPLAGGAQVEWFEAVLGDSRDVITVVDRDGAILYQTPSAAVLTGLPAGALTGKHIADLFPDLSRRRFMELLVLASHDDDARGPYDFPLLDAWGRRHDTETVITPLSAQGLDGFVLTTNDVSDRRRLRAALVDSSTRDSLTGLPNREGFLSRVREAVPAAAPETVCVALLDLNSFRDLNDSRGHTAGDQVLKAVAAALERLPESVVAVGRTGADEFGMLISADPLGQELGDVERLLRESLRGLLIDDARPVDLDFAFGYAAKSQRTDTAAELVERADLALAAARAARSPSAVTYRPDMRSALVARLRSEADLRDALDADRLLVYYQPIVTLPDHRLHSVEALARMVTPSGEIVGPAGFIPRAEELGLIGRLGLTVLNRALRDSNAISAAVGRPIAVSVNVSAAQVDDSLPEIVFEALRSAGVPPERLVLELTESLLAEGQDESGEVLDRIRAMGCQVALDDFGTGYSSLSYLAGLPVDLMKIDKSFIGRLGTSGESFALVRTLLQLAQNLGLATVAEGVETVEQADVLRGMNCSRAQGYLFAHPLPLAELEALLDESGGVLPVGSGRGGSVHR